MKRTSNKTMHTEAATDSIAEDGKGVLESLDESLDKGWEAIGRGTWHLFHVLPGQGTIPGFAVGLGAAMLVASPSWQRGLHGLCQLPSVRVWRVVERGDRKCYQVRRRQARKGRNRQALPAIDVPFYCIACPRDP